MHNDAVFVFGVAHELGFEPEVSYIHSLRIRTYASRDEAYHALLKTLDYRDPSIDQVDRETAAHVYVIGFLSTYSRKSRKEHGSSISHRYSLGPLLVGKLHNGANVQESNGSDK